jgi:hypothetical protein
MSGELFLDRAAMCKYPVAHELIEALVLYKNLTVVVNCEDDIRSLISIFGPPNFVRLMDEFHESIKVGVNATGLYNLELRPARLWNGSDPPYLYHQTMTERMSHSGGLCFYGPSWDESIWRGEGAGRTFERLALRNLPDNFYRALLTPGPVLNSRVHAYLMGGRQPVTAGSKVDVEIDDLTDTNVGAVRVFVDGRQLERFDAHSFVLDNIQLYAFAEGGDDAHIMTSNERSLVLAHDAMRLFRRIDSGAVTRRLFTAAAIRDAPDFGSLADVHRVGDELYGAVVKARQLRLEIPDGEDAAEMVRQMRYRPWIERLPLKIARFSLFTGAGALIDLQGGGGLGTVSGLALGAFDEFLIDKLADKWRPNLRHLDYASALRDVFAKT